METEEPSCLPSVVTDQWWLYVYPRTAPNLIVTPTGGKWLVFIPVRYVDRYWALIATAVRDGTLGPAAKVATALPNPHSVDPTRRPIVVYTADWHDTADVQRVLENLRILGISWRLTYKTNDSTTAGDYGRAAGTYVSPSNSSDLVRIRSRDPKLPPP